MMSDAKQKTRKVQTNMPNSCWMAFLGARINVDQEPTKRLSNKCWANIIQHGCYMFLTDQKPKTLDQPSLGQKCWNVSPGFYSIRQQLGNDLKVLGEWFFY